MLEIATLYPRLFRQRGSGSEVDIYDVTTLFPAYSFLIIETQGLWKRVFDWGHLLEKLGHHREIESRRFEHQPFDQTNGKFYTCFILLMFSPSQNPCNSSPCMKHATCRLSFVDDSYAWFRPAGFTSFLSRANGSVLKKPLAAHNLTKYLSLQLLWTFTPQRS